MRGKNAHRIASEARKKRCERGDLTKTKTYITTHNSGSLQCTLSPTARTMLEIEQGTELEQFIDIEMGAVVIIPKTGDGDSDGE